MNPGKGREIKITASGTLPDGKRVSTSTKFRIKDIPSTNRIQFEVKWEPLKFLKTIYL